MCLYLTVKRKLNIVLVVLAALIFTTAPAGAQNHTLPEKLQEKIQEKLPEKLTGHGGPVKSITLDEENSTALSSSFDYSIIQWDLTARGGKIIHRMLGHKAAVNDVDFIPNNGNSPKRAVSVSDDGSLAIWNLQSGKLIKIIEDTGDKVLDVEVSKNGNYAAIARWDATARIYDLNSYKQIHRFEGHRGNVNAVNFSHDSGLLFTASYDGDIRAWHVGKANSNKDFQHGGIIHSAGWGINVIHLMPDGNRLLFGTINGVIAVLDLSTRAAHQIGSFQHPILSIAMSEKSGWFAAGGSDGHIRIFDSKTFTPLDDYKGFNGPIWGLAFSKNGKTLYRAGLNDFISRWQVKPKERFKYSQNQKPHRFQQDHTNQPGEAEFKRKCSICHTLLPDDKNRAGPSLYKLFGRKAGSLKGYNYSKALKESELIWSAKTISRLFEEGPDIVTPGSKMPLQRLKKVERRNSLIDYLKRATKPQ